MEIALRSSGLDASKARNALKQDLGFGRIFADQMFLSRWSESRGWHDSEIVPYGLLPIDPAAMVLHYGQEIFEGQKAYRWADGRIGLFRPEANAARMNRSARRLVMPEIPEERQVEAIARLVTLIKEWVPEPPSSLYIRPTMIATEAALGVRAAKEFLYFVICSPVGPYFPKGFAPIRVLAESKYVRAAEGGTGEAKTGGNYAGSLLAATQAKEKGYDQVLWLDAKEHSGVEEIGAMNILFVADGKLVTSPLHGSILPGVTRDSILKLARDEGRTVEERSMKIHEVIEGARSGRVTEAFGAGTAAVITPIGAIGYQGQDQRIADGNPGEWTTHFYKTLTDYQYGKAKDPYGWMHVIG